MNDEKTGLSITLVGWPYYFCHNMSENTAAAQSNGQFERKYLMNRKIMHDKRN